MNEIDTTKTTQTTHYALRSTHHVKVCGLREAGHVGAAAQAGARMLGFVFAESRRRVEAGEAAELIAGVRRELGAGAPVCVGLFVNEAPGRIAAVVAECGLDIVQLCGDEPPDAAALLTIARPVIRVFRPTAAGADGLDAEIVAWDAAAEAADAEGGALSGPWGSRLLVCLDAAHPGAYGGTGRLADWEIAARLAARRPLMLAGGLTPENIAAAVVAVRPWAVDVSSGVETGGVKDVGLIAAFIERAHEETLHDH
ncbi:MAG: phosphoribosylanthranilate isomerase [Chloroflexia bacterium]